MKLKEELNKNNKLKIDLDNYIKENNKLKGDLLKANKIIANIGNNNTNNNEIMNLKFQLLQKDNEIKDLKYQLLEKNNEIKDLKLKLQSNNEKNKQVLNMDEIMIVYFQTQDQEINHVAIRCLSSDTFAEIEEKLYKKFENFRNTNNTPICNGRTILRFHYPFVIIDILNLLFLYLFVVFDFLNLKFHYYLYYYFQNYL